MIKPAPSLHPWWTPSGWQYRPAPADFPDPDSGADWETLLAVVDYQRAGPVPPPERVLEMEYRVWPHVEDRHLFVQLWDIAHSLAWFFVEEKDTAAFYVDRYPSLLMTMIRAGQIARASEPKAG